ncbi:MAG: hypothetical protein ACREFS_08380, partial [Acetobacteraceae bacterium]
MSAEAAFFVAMRTPMKGAAMRTPPAPGSDTRVGRSPTDQAGRRPAVPYWHLWTDEAGTSHQQRCVLTEWTLKGVGGAAPQWNDQQASSDATVVFTVQPVGWVGDWHENPAPQW